MDPASIIALAASVISIIDVIGKSLSFLLDLQTKYRKASLTVSLLIGQLSTVKAALNQISQWITTSLVGVPQHQQLVADLDVSLEACKVLVLVLDDRIFRHESSLTSQVKAAAKARFLWEEKDMNDYLNLLNNQINALNLLLTALQWAIANLLTKASRTLFEQRDLLQSSESRHIIKMVEDDTSSLLWIRDTESYSCYSRKSALTENSVMLDTVFDFDREIFHSRAYQVAARSNMKQALINGKRTNMQHEVSDLALDSGLANFIKLDDDDQDIQTIKEVHTNFSQPLSNTTDAQISKDSPLRLNLLTKENSALPDPLTGRSHRLVEFLGDRKESRRKPWSLANAFKSRKIQHAREKAQPTTTSRMESQRKELNCCRVLLLGASESGKTTILKSLQLLLRGGYTLAELGVFKKIIFSYMIQSMRVLLEEMEGLEMPLDDQKNVDHVSTILMQPVAMEVESLAPGVMDAMTALWKDSNVEYLPTEQDILRSYVKTTGISRSTFLTEDGYLADVFDVGGARAERKKWVHLRENVDSILFCVDISAYDRVLHEDGMTNRMQEALAWFSIICNSSRFAKTDIMLYFTKTDLLEPKLAITPIQSCFPGYSGDPTDPHAVMEYICDRFVELNQNSEKRIRVQFSDIRDVWKTATTISESIDDCIQEKGMALTRVGLNALRAESLSIE
ncbi:MAG: hypothetical protein Q9187_005958 [Circinaria calcarea]